MGADGSFAGARIQMQEILAFISHEDKQKKRVRAE